MEIETMPYSESNISMKVSNIIKIKYRGNITTFSMNHSQLLLPDYDNVYRIQNIKIYGTDTFSISY